MAVDEKIRNEKLQYDINRDAAKISELLSGKIDKYKFLADGEILSSDQSRILDQAKFTYPPLGKGLAKQTKTIEEQGKNNQMLFQITTKDQRL